MNKTKKKIKVFIAGNSGFLGTYLAKRLKKNFKIYSHSNKIKKKKFINQNLVNKHRTLRLLNKLDPDIVINSSGYTSVDGCEKYKKKAYKLNVLITKNLASYCKQSSKYLIHISTDQVYNKIFSKSENKETDKKISNYYSLTKKLSENEALKCNSLILRTNFFGNNFISKSGLANWIINLKKNQTIDVFTNVLFSPLYVESLAEIIGKILLKKKKGIFNLGSSDSVSKAKFIIKMCKVFKKKVKFNEIIYKKNYKKLLATRSINMSMDTRKFSKAFKIKLPKIDNEIKKFYEKYKNK